MASESVAIITILILRILAELAAKAPEIAEIISKDPNITVDMLMPTPKEDITGE